VRIRGSLFVLRVDTRKIAQVKGRERVSGILVKAQRKDLDCEKKSFEEGFGVPRCLLR